MPGTYTGGTKAAATNKKRYGEDYYKTIGKMGGAKSVGGGFAKNRELAREAGRKGGQISRKPKPQMLEEFTVLAAPKKKHWWSK